MSLRIRPATREDAAFLGQVMLLASRSHLERGIWDHMLEAPEDVCLRFLEQLAMTETRSFNHYAHYCVAEVDGRPAAALCGYDPDQSGIQTLGPACFEAGQAIGWDAGRMARVGERSLAVATCMSDEPPGSWIVENVATLAAYRRRGLINDLLRHVVEQGRASGHRLGQVSVLIGNTSAQCAYERAGFAVVDEKRHADFQAALGCPGVRRLQRAL